MIPTAKASRDGPARRSGLVSCAMGRRPFGRGDAGGPDRLNLDQPSLGGADVGTGKTGRKVACAAAVMTLLAVASGCGSDSSSESSSKDRKSVV